MKATTLEINGQEYNVRAAPGTMLLWVLREHLGLTGTKYACGKSYCGSCTIHMDGKPVKACVTPLSLAAGRKIITIEGLAEDGKHPLQIAWEKHQIPQCGYCQSGMIMQAAALLRENNRPSRDEIIASLNGNLCRCGTYYRIIDAIQQIDTIK